MNKQQLAKAFVAGDSGPCHNAVTDGQTYWLHGHAIAVKTDGGVVFYWHGFWTITTASHMNEVLRALGAPFRVSRSTAAKEGQTHFVYNPTRTMGPKD
jgi:hypothetical protein